MIPRAFALAFVLPVAVALAVLAARAGNGFEGRGPTILGEREARVTPRTSDRSVAEVWLEWSGPAGQTGAWMTREMLAGLGFDLAVDPGDPRAELHYRRQLSRRAFVAFELDGPAWQAVMAEREAVLRGADAPPGLSERPPAETFGVISRLVPVDAARDAGVLAQRYPDPRSHLITAAVVRIALFALPRQAPYVGGVLADIDPRRIQVPSEFAALLPASGGFDAPRTRYTLSLVYGARWEPRVVAVDSGSPP